MGVFAIAPLLLPMFILSAAVASSAALVCVVALRRRRWDVSMAIVGGLHGAIVWYAATHK